MPTVLRAVRDRAIVDPTTWRIVVRDVVRRPRRAEGLLPSTDDRIALTAAWLRRAHDATADGGISWGYHLGRGWAATYPETSGYLIPTLLTLAATGGEEGDRARAGRVAEALLRVQRPSGAFPGGVLGVGANPDSAFNSAQILDGLAAFHAADGDPGVFAAARRTAAWLVATQDADGAWRSHAYRGLPVTYMSHGSCWLARFGVAHRLRDVVAAAERHLDWVLSQRDPATGWFDRTGFTARVHKERIGVTHTIAYTIRGVLELGLALDRHDAVDAALTAAEGVRGTVERLGRLPAILDHQWRTRSGATCLTGNAQMALVWRRLAAEVGSSAAFQAAATRCLVAVAASVSGADPNPGVRGGVPGSAPIWGAYLPYVFPNWAAKFWLDALLVERYGVDPSDLTAASRSAAKDASA
jgi:hypothetical protein